MTICVVRIGRYAFSLEMEDAAEWMKIMERAVHVRQVLDLDYVRREAPQPYSYYVEVPEAQREEIECVLSPGVVEKEIRPALGGSVFDWKPVVEPIDMSRVIVSGGRDEILS